MDQLFTDLLTNLLVTYVGNPPNKGSPLGVVIHLRAGHFITSVLLLQALLHYCAYYYIVVHIYIMLMTPVSILYKSIAGRYRPVRAADGPITARYRFIKNASWDCRPMYHDPQSTLSQEPHLTSPVE